MTAWAFLRENPSPTPEEIRVAIAGNLCRCTGYQNIVDAIEAAAIAVRGGDGKKVEALPGAARSPE